MTGAPIYDDPQEALEAAINGATAEQIAESVSARNLSLSWEYAEGRPDRGRSARPRVRARGRPRAGCPVRRPIKRACRFCGIGVATMFLPQHEQACAKRRCTCQPDAQTPSAHCQIDHREWPRRAA